MKKNIFILMALSLFMISCDDMFEPLLENNREKDIIYKEAAFAEGILATVYNQIPTNGYSFNDVATDDAVSNLNTNGYRRIAAGQWSSSNDPLSRWNSCYNAILYLNTLIEEAKLVPWANDEYAQRLFTARVEGEAYGLRALFFYYLLQAHAGDVDGQLMGVPLITWQQDQDSDFNIPRSDFKTVINQIYSDLDEAEKRLPMEYADIKSGTDKVPDKYVNDFNIPDTLSTTYNRVFGEKFRGRVNGLIAKSVRAQVALLAASPAYLNGGDNSWEYAALSAAEVLNYNKGVSGLASNGATWYANQDEIDGLSNGKNPPEIIWRHSKGANKGLESEHYPPSLRGNGRCNPTQNLVNAFPTESGYPINHQNSGYNAAIPYASRDPRLAKYIVYHGSQFGPSSSTITIASGTSDDVMNKERGKSTRTGYYMRKFMKETTNLNPNSAVTKDAYQARIRYTELYLIYAEAANEAYGPEGTPADVSYSAYDVIKAIRSRAGIGTRSGDPYLESIKNDKEAMRQLIRNERRLELCFEGHRFWDLRRWKENLNEPARGINVSGGAVDLGATGEGVVVDNRDYKDYMYYGPIPLSEVLKWSNLNQNTGW